MKLVDIEIEANRREIELAVGYLKDILEGTVPHELIFHNDGRGITIVLVDSEIEDKAGELK